MNCKTRTCRADFAARASWSTRLVILIAFAVQLAPVSDRLGSTSLRTSERLALLEGSFATLWLAEGRIQEAGDRPGTDLPNPRTDLRSIPTQSTPLGHVPTLASIGRALLPTPPPALG